MRLPAPAAAQVEHGITELVNGGVDLVEWMLRLQLPGMEPLDLDSITTERSGHSIEVREGGGRGAWCRKASASNTTHKHTST